MASSLTELVEKVKAYKNVEVTGFALREPESENYKEEE